MQNRNKLIDLFIGNIATAIVHEILEKAIGDENLRRYYDKEFRTSFAIAKKYREKINPADKPLKISDQTKIKKDIVLRVKKELMIRIEKGYKNIEIGDIGIYADEALKKLKIK